MRHARSCTEVRMKSNTCQQCFASADQVVSENTSSLGEAIIRYNQLVGIGKLPAMCQQKDGQHWICHLGDAGQAASRLQLAEPALR